MKVGVAAILGAMALVLLVCVGAASADTMVVAGQRVTSPTSFVVEGEEIFAPLLTTLPHLGGQFEFTPDAIRITTDSGREITISRSRPEATMDGVLRELPGPPRMKDRVTLLPARAVGSMLGCAVRWEEGSRTLFIHPWVRTFVLARLPDRYRLTIAAETPITYESGQLEGPPRLYLDLFNADVSDIPSEFRTEAGYLQGARIHQNSLAPAPEGDVARVVVYLTEWKPYRIRLSEDRRRLEVDFPLPEAEEVPPEVPRVVLSGIGFRRLSSRLAAVMVSVSGVAYCTSGVAEDGRGVWVDIANAENRMTNPKLQVSDLLVSGVSIDPVPEQPGTQRLTVSLTGPVGHAVVSEEGQLRVLLGTFELAELSVVIDPGHGGHDAGAIGRSGLQEKDVNLDIAHRVYRRLQAMGVRVRLTRVDDSPLRPWRPGNRAENRRELLSRCAVANDMNADLFVSIHSNARESNPMDHRGTETYYRKADSAAFAQVMQAEVVRAVGLPDAGVHRHPKPIIVICQTNMPAVLVEVGYLSNPADEAELATSGLRDRAAQGIVNGIRRFVEQGGLLPRLERRRSE